jgi:quercetin dioxygenase-like cupin family protein
VRACPADRIQANARSGSDPETIGVDSTDIALTALADDAGPKLRLRRLVLAPGAVIRWHDHLAVQGMAMIVSGELVELRNTCLDPIVYRAGDIAREDIGTAHGWRNESGAEAVVLVMHVVPRQP